MKPIDPELWNDGVRELDRLLALIDAPDGDGTVFGDGTTVYGREDCTVERYITAGNGPTVWVVFVIGDGDIKEAFLSVSAWGDDALIPIPEPHREALLASLRADNTELERHG